MYHQSVSGACDCSDVVARVLNDPGLHIYVSRAKQVWIFDVGKQASAVRSIHEIVHYDHDYCVQGGLHVRLFGGGGLGLERLTPFAHAHFVFILERLFRSAPLLIRAGDSYTCAQHFNCVCNCQR